jgi:ribosomal protein S18 acetylase RimI-like enzyme
VLSLRPLTAADIPLVQPWFDDEETRHWLGGRDWPRKSLKLAGPNRHELLAIVDATPIGMVDIEVEHGRAAFAVVIAPAVRRQKLGQQMVVACMAEPIFAEVEEWFAGVERGNIASRQLLESLGFLRMTDEDADGFTYFAYRRSGWADSPWSPYGLQSRIRPGRLRKLGASG